MQEIIVLIIGIVVGALILYKIYQFFFSKAKNKSSCGCSSCGCGAKKNENIL